MNNKKLKKKKVFKPSAIASDRILRNKTDEWFEMYNNITQQNDVEQIIKRSEEMERYNLFLIHQNQYWYDINSSQIYL